MAILSTLLTILLALLRVSPATLAAVESRRQREAQQRLQEKDARVDAAIDGPQ